MTAYEMLKQELTKAGKSSMLQEAWHFIIGCHEKEELSQRFSQKALPAVTKVWEQFQIECEASYKLTYAIDLAIADAVVTFDDEVIAEPHSYAIVYSDRVEVTALVKGMGDRLPKENRKYVGEAGDVRWKFPLGSLEQLRPIVDFVLNEDGSKNV